MNNKNLLHELLHELLYSMSHQPILVTYGQRILEKYNLDKVRKEFTFNFSLDSVDLHKEINSFLELELGFMIEQIRNVKIVKKMIDRSGLKWHVDDCQIISCSNTPQYNLDKFIYLEGNKYLYCTSSLPKYTIVLYGSTYKEDFEGGILQFADNTHIKPKKQNGILFDSREVHQVTPVTKGSRTSILIKIY